MSCATRGDEQWYEGFNLRAPRVARVAKSQRYQRRHTCCLVPGGWPWLPASCVKILRRPARWDGKMYTAYTSALHKPYHLTNNATSRQAVSSDNALVEQKITGLVGENVACFSMGVIATGLPSLALAALSPGFSQWTLDPIADHYLMALGCNDMKGRDS